MDLAWGAKRVIVAMTHNAKDGKAKVVRELSLPVTCRKSVNLIVTDLAVIQVTNQGLVLIEYAPGWNPEEILARTDAPMTVAQDAHEMEF
jgi:3-oxoacid CoA-transferase subunit B